MNPEMPEVPGILEPPPDGAPSDGSPPDGPPSGQHENFRRHYTDLFKNKNIQMKQP